MESIEQPTVKLLLPKQKTLEELHHECQTWLSEIEFWNLELNFFQKLLTKGFQKSRSKSDDYTNDVLEGKLIQFKQEAIDDFKEDIMDHEYYLSDLLKFNSEYSDDMFRENHFVHANHLIKLERNFKNLKKELFEYVLTLPF